MNIEITSFLDDDSETFTYVVEDKASSKAVIIDPVLDFDYSAGRVHTASAQKIADFVDERGLLVEWVLETHAHADHLSAAPFFKRKYNAKIGIGARITEAVSYTHLTLPTIYSV